MVATPTDHVGPEQTRGTPRGYGDGCRCEQCRYAKRRANQLSKLRSGEQHQTTDGMTLAVCWCGRTTRLVHVSEIGRRTETCDRTAPEKGYLDVRSA
jgi:hypothetical protein